MKITSKKVNPTIIIPIFIVIFLTACSEQKESYIQSVLIPPSSIILTNDNTEIIYTNVDEEYNKIYQAINKNWWYSKSPEKWTDIFRNVRDDHMMPMKSTDPLIKIQGLSSENQINDVLIIFEYQEPITWDNRNWSRYQEEILYIVRYGFIPPEKTDEQNISGYMVISENKELFGQFNEYVYYYNEELYQVLNELGYYTLN